MGLSNSRVVLESPRIPSSPKEHTKDIGNHQFTSSSGSGDEMQVRNSLASSNFVGYSLVRQSNSVWTFLSLDGE